jgi:hypothetical protein
VAPGVTPSFAPTICIEGVAVVHAWAPICKEVCSQEFSMLKAMKSKYRRSANAAGFVHRFQKVAMLVEPVECNCSIEHMGIASVLSTLLRSHASKLSVYTDNGATHCVPLAQIVSRWNSKADLQLQCWPLYKELAVSVVSGCWQCDVSLIVERDKYNLWRPSGKPIFSTMNSGIALSDVKLLHIGELGCLRDTKYRWKAFTPSHILRALRATKSLKDARKCADTIDDTLKLLFPASHGEK